MAGTDWTKVRKAHQKREIEKTKKLEEERKEMAKKNKGKSQPKKVFFRHEGRDSRRNGNREARSGEEG